MSQASVVDPDTYGIKLKGRIRISIKLISWTRIRTRIKLKGRIRIRTLIRLQMTNQNV